MDQPSGTSTHHPPGEPSSLLPARFFDGRVAASVYSVPIDRAREAVGPRQLHPIELPGRKAFAVICTFEYLSSTLGAYREFAVGVVVNPRQQPGPFSTLDLFTARPDTGAWIVSMPVTSETVRGYGVDLFGFPKFVASVDVERTSSLCKTTVSDGSSTIIKTEIALGFGLKIPVPWLVTYTQKGDAVLRTRIKTNWWVTLSRGGTSSIEISDSDHPLARALRGLSPAKSPIIVLHGERFRGILPAGERI